MGRVFSDFFKVTYLNELISKAFARVTQPEFWHSPAVVVRNKVAEPIELPSKKPNPNLGLDRFY